MELLGKTLGNYRIDRLLGEGGMGAVYQAYDLTLQRDVAIKLIHPHFARRTEFRDRFLQEARLMARLDHPGIVKVFLLGKEEDLFYLPMEFIKGGNLRQLLDKLIQEQRWIPLSEAVLLMQQLCQTVEYAHQHNVLHRDIKPDNLMLKPETMEGLPFRVILTDLGLAKLLQGLGMTQEGTYLGTPAYMSPEQASGQNTDARSDVYSLGILLYELAVGRLPFAVHTATEAMRYHVQTPPPLPRSFRPDLPESLERVILKALEKKPDNRYASAAQMATALKSSGATTEIAQRTALQDVSLITTYQESVIGPAKLQTASIMTMIEDGKPPSRGESVFVNQSLAASSKTRIQVIYKGTEAQVFPLPSGTAIIGRSSNNDIPLADPKASQRHAQVTWDGMEYHVMDLNSRNGTYLGNTKLLPGVPEVWQAHQNLRIGDTWLRLIDATTGIQSRVGAGPRSTASVMRSRSGNSIYTSSGAGLVGVTVTPQQLSLATGESGTVTIALLNQSPNVDHFSLSLTGIPSDWITSLPPSVQLMPGEQKETAFTLLAPRAPQSRAGQHAVKLRVISERDPNQFVEVRLNLTIAPYSQFKAELQPQRIQAGQTARLTIANQGNTTETFAINLQDREAALDFRLLQKELPIQEGQSKVVEFTAQPRQRRWMGGEKTHALTARVGLPKGDAQTLSAEFLSRGLIPIWMVPTVMLVCLLCIGVALPFSGLLPFPPQSPTMIITAALFTPDLPPTLPPTTPAESPTQTISVPLTQTSQAEQIQQTQTIIAQQGGETQTSFAVIVQQTQAAQTQQAQILTSQALTSQAQVAANATATAQAMACFLGDWVPTNPNGGLARLVIERVNQVTYSFHGYGECTPTACDWGVIEFPFSSPKLIGTFQFGFKSTRVTVECIANSQLSAEVFDDYTVADGRTDQTHFYTLKRRPIIVVPLPTLGPANP